MVYVYQMIVIGVKKIEKFLIFLLFYFILLGFFWGANSWAQNNLKKHCFEDFKKGNLIISSYYSSGSGCSIQVNLIKEHSFYSKSYTFREDGQVSIFYHLKNNQKLSQSTGIRVFYLLPLKISLDFIVDQDNQILSIVTPAGALFNFSVQTGRLETVTLLKWQEESNSQITSSSKLSDLTRFEVIPESSEIFLVDFLFNQGAFPDKQDRSIIIMKKNQNNGKIQRCNILAKQLFVYQYDRGGFNDLFFSLNPQQFQHKMNQLCRF